MQGTVKGSKGIETKTLVKIAILSAIAYLLMFISIPIPGIFPDFLKIDISDIPGIFGGMAMGPLAGFAIIFIKNMLQLVTASFTGGIGEIANTIIGGTYVLVVCYAYKKRSDIKGIITGAIIGTVAMTVVGCIMNYYVMMPLYGQMMGMDSLIAMASALNPRVNDLFTFVVWMIAPFNIIKATIMSLAILPLYKKMGKVLKK